MGLVKISESMHADLRLAGQAFSRSINAQAEHWLRVGMLAELHPHLGYPALCRLMLQAEASGKSLLADGTLATPADSLGPQEAAA